MKKFPNFKEKFNTEESIKLDKMKLLVKEILPNLTDDDYFLDKKDSVVYTYLMNENVNLYIKILNTNRMLKRESER